VTADTTQRFRIISNRYSPPLRLTHLKLAGFKSFVDPTQVPLPGQIVGIVGPNG